MKTKTPLSGRNRHFNKVFAQKLSWRTKKEFRITKFAAGSQRNVVNRTDFVGKLKCGKMSVPKSNNRKRKISEEGKSFN